LVEESLGDEMVFGSVKEMTLVEESPEKANGGFSTKSIIVRGKIVRYYN
jgi:hypothetical protein